MQWGFKDDPGLSPAPGLVVFLPGDKDSLAGGVIITTQARVFGILCLKRNIAFMYAVIPLTISCFVFNTF